MQNSLVKVESTKKGNTVNQNETRRVTNGESYGKMANWMSAVKLEVISSSLIRDAVPVWHFTPIYFFVVFSVVLLLLFQQVQISIKLYA